jgi:hypothetical protein
LLATEGFCWQLIMAGRKIMADLHVSNSSAAVHIRFSHGGNRNEILSCGSAVTIFYYFSLFALLISGKMTRLGEYTIRAVLTKY